MPELPEVETTRRGIEPHIKGQRIAECYVRQPSLRWPVPVSALDAIKGEPIERVERRGKYLQLVTPVGVVLVHLGMSGSLRVLTEPLAAGKHDHVDICMENGAILRLNDPRRFGSVLWDDLTKLHPLLADLGPEPLSDDFSGDYLYRSAAKRRVAIKQHIMNSQVVVGVGNIYANEALFRAGIDPRRQAGRISHERMTSLVAEIKQVLAAAIEQGGTTLRDFVNSEGKPGYFKQSLNVYGRGGQPCVTCGTALSEIRQGQRATVFCADCQR